MRLTVAITRLTPRIPFHIARGVKHCVDNVFVTLEQDGLMGRGEASPNAFYNEYAPDIAARLEALAPCLSSTRVATIDDIENLWHDLWPRVAPSRAAQCALDIALWDLVSRFQATTVSQLLWNTPAQPLLSSVTLGICAPGDEPAQIAALGKAPWIKVKMNATTDPAIIDRIHALSNARIGVDANGAWSPDTARSLIHRLAQAGVLYVEQPLPPHLDQAMTVLQDATAIPLIADESCPTPDHLAQLSSAFGGINIKLVKCGGLTPARQMVSMARARGLCVMVGCMLESNLLIAAGAALAQKADYVDLDGAWLLEDALFSGVSFDNGMLHLSGRHGLGVEPASAGTA